MCRLETADLAGIPREAWSPFSTALEEVWVFTTSTSSKLPVMVGMQGTIAGHEQEYALDEGHTFERSRPALVCGNTAAMLGEDGLSWLSPHFQVQFCHLCLYQRKARCQQAAIKEEAFSIVAFMRTSLYGVQIIGDRSTHYGAFDCGPPPATASKPAAAAAPSNASCSPSSGCCWSDSKVWCCACQCEQKPTQLLIRLYFNLCWGCSESKPTSKEEAFAEEVPMPVHTVIKTLCAFESLSQIKILYLSGNKYI